MILNKLIIENFYQLKKILFAILFKQEKED